MGNVKLPHWLQTMVDQTIQHAERAAWPPGGYPALAFDARNQIGQDGDGDTQAALLQLLIDKIERLRVAVAKMSHRKCWDCGHIAYYLDAIALHCLCEKCGSLDTRLVREAAEAGGER